MHPSAPGMAIETPPRWPADGVRLVPTAVLLVVGYVLVGGLVLVATFYDIELYPFVYCNVGWPPPLPGLILLSILDVAFLRGLAAIATGIALAIGVKSSASSRVLCLVGVGTPVLFELVVIWFPLEQFRRMRFGWQPLVRELAYLAIPAALTGAVMAGWAICLRNRAEGRWICWRPLAHTAAGVLVVVSLAGLTTWHLTRAERLARAERTRAAPTDFSLTFGTRPSIGRDSAVTLFAAILAIGAFEWRARRPSREAESIA